MISLIKNTLIRRNLLLRPRFAFAKSLGQQIQRNKAILALQIITTIKNSPLNQYRADEPYPSLREKILQLIDTYKIDVRSEPEQDRITSAVRYSLRRYFVDGVWVPEDMCSQSRFREKSKSYSMLKNLREEVQINIDEDNQDKQLEFRKLKFCPTYFVTGQIFRKILQDQDVQFLTGQYGVGKTYSFILYTLLSQIIFRYRHKYYPHESILNLDSGIFNEIPKAFYWCINKHLDYHEPTKLNGLIKRHFYQLKDKKEYNHDIMRANKSIAKILLNYDIKTILLMDQVSQLASILRDQINYKLQVIQFMKSIIQNKNKSYTQQTKQNTQTQFNRLKLSDNIFEDLIENTKKLVSLSLPQTIPVTDGLKKKKDAIKDFNDKYFLYKRILHKIIQRRHFTNIIFLSSVDLQRHLLDQLQLLGPTKQDSIKTAMKRIQYPATFFGDVLLSDTAQFIAFNLRNKWVDKFRRELSLQEKNLLNKVKKQFQKQLRNEEFCFFLPLKIKQTIRQSLQSKSDESEKDNTPSQLVKQNQSPKNSNQRQQRMGYKKFLEEDKKGQLHLYIINQLRKIQEQSVALMESKLNAFLHKKIPTTYLQNYKYYILNQLWGKAKQLMNNIHQQSEIRPNQTKKDRRDQRLDFLPQFHILLPDKDIGKSLQPSMPHHLFGFYQNDNLLQCFVNPRILLQLINSQRKQIYSGLLAIQQGQSKHFLDSKTAQGIGLQSALIDFLINGQTSFEVNLSKKAQNKIQMENILPKIGGFIPIPYNNKQEYKDFNFLDSIIRSLEALQKEQYHMEGVKNLLLLPLFQKWYYKEIQILQKKIHDIDVKKFFTTNSKVIDFVICKMIDIRKAYKVEVNVFDPTVNQKSQIIYKVQRFFEELANFKDKYDSIFINGKQFQVVINYIVLVTNDAMELNCKKLIANKIEDFKKEVQNMDSSNQLKEEKQKILKNMQQYKLQDCGETCNITMNQRYKSGNPVVNTISMINLCKKTKLICRKPTKVSIELRLLKKILPKLTIMI